MLLVPFLRFHAQSMLVYRDRSNGSKKFLRIPVAFTTILIFPFLLLLTLRSVVGKEQSTDQYSDHGKNVLAVFILGVVTTRRNLGTCLTSIKDHVYTTHEVIVIDNASSDGSPELVENEHPDVVLIRSTANIGFSAANNLGMARAKGDHLVLLNSDTVVTPDSITAWLHAHQHANATISGPTLVYVNGAPRSSKSATAIGSVLEAICWSLFLLWISTQIRRRSQGRFFSAPQCYFTVRFSGIRWIGSDPFLYGGRGHLCARHRKWWILLAIPNASDRAYRRTKLSESTFTHDQQPIDQPDQIRTQTPKRIRNFHGHHGGIHSRDHACYRIRHRKHVPQRAARKSIPLYFR